MAVLATIFGLHLYVVNPSAGEQPLYPAAAVATALTYPWIGALLTSADRPSHRLGWLFSAGLLVGLSFLFEQYGAYALANPGGAPGGVWSAWLGTWLWAPGALSVSTLIVLLFPDGRPPSPRWRPVLLTVVVCIAATTVLAALAPGPFPSYPADNPLGIAWLPEASPTLAAVCVLVLGPICLGGLVWRYRRAGGPRRTQLRWFATAAAAAVLAPFPGLLVPLGVLPLTAYQVLGAGSLVAVPVAAAVAIVKLRLYDLAISEITRLVNRSLVAVGVATISLMTYWLVVVVLRVRPLVGVGAIAVGFYPLRRELRRGIERARTTSRAHAALLELGRRLEDTVAPDEVLPASVESVARALDLSYVAIEVRDVDGGVIAAEVRGEVRPDAEVFDLLHHNQVVGRLAVASSNRERRLAPDDRLLLEQLCGQLGVAAHGVRQTAALHRTKERLVTEHEEERTRLRRAHHDGIKPALSGVICELDAVLNMCADGDDGPLGLLRRVADQVVSAKAMVGSISTDIRRLSDDRGPLRLDELGLVGALRHHVAKFGLPPTDLVLNVHAAEDLKGLPTGMEVNVFLLVCEAVENVRKHASATRCDIVLGLGDGSLHVEVSDDGVGLQPGHEQGVGMSSMEARVEELDGELSVQTGPGTGVRVRADLPLPGRRETPDAAG